MAALEQFSVSWDNFHEDIKSGVNSLLENEDLVDVTLAIEGRYLKAHKMVLSVCSSYFKELFKTSPCKHPIVFMKDVSYTAMSDLLQFMYKGQVQVTEESFNTFIKTAESLQIRGLSKAANECGTESQRKKTKLSNSEVLTTDNLNVYSPKRLRIDVHPAPNHDDIVRTGYTVVKESPSTSSLSNELIVLKPEPSEEEESSFRITDDDSIENIFDDPLDEVKPIFHESEGCCIKENTDVDENDDYWMMPSYNEPSQTTSKDKILTEEVSSENEDPVGAVIPEKSKERYEHTLTCFEQWCNENNVKDIEEDVLIKYFKEKSVTYKSSSLMTVYSMLRSMISIKKNIDISGYRNLLLFLKKLAAGYVAKKSKVLQKEHFERFLRDANDDIFLMQKVVMIIGVAGAFNKNELTYLKTENVIDEGNIIRVQLRDANNEISRECIITAGNIQNVNLIEIIRKYIRLRPPGIDHNRFFVCYRQGKCTKQPVGKNGIGSIPKNIAQLFGLPNPEQYTGHCIRKISTLFRQRSFP